MKILVKFDDGDFLVTSINSTLEEAKKYYLGNTFVKSDETCHKAIELSLTYPLYMCKGSAGVPARFWEYLLVNNLQEEKEANEKGFVRSNTVFLQD